MKQGGGCHAPCRYRRYGFIGRRVISEILRSDPGAEVRVLLPPVSLIRPVDPPLRRRVHRPVPRLRTSHGSELLRRGPDGVGVAATLAATPVRPRCQRVQRRVQDSSPRCSAYLPSKAALDTFAEVVVRGDALRSRDVHHHPHAGRYLAQTLSRRALHQLYLGYPDSAAARGVPAPERHPRRPARPQRSALQVRVPHPVKRVVRMVPGVHW